VSKERFLNNLTPFSKPWFSVMQELPEYIVMEKPLERFSAKNPPFRFSRKPLMVFHAL
jgi:hypothetical protein